MPGPSWNISRVRSGEQHDPLPRHQERSGVAGTARCREKRPERAYRPLRSLNRQIIEARRRHRAVMHLYRQKREFMASVLKGEMRS